MLQRYELEVDSLNEWPDHPVLLQGRRIGLVELILRAASLHDSHAAEEDEEVGGRKNGLIDSNARSDLEVLVLQYHLVLEKLEPCCGSGTEDCWGR